MGSSSERKKRQAEKLEGVHKKQISQQKKMEKEAKIKRNYTIGGVVIAVLVLVIVVLNTNLFYTVFPAVKVGDESFTAAEYNYFYYTGYNNFMNTYGDYASYMIDSSVPLDEQMYDDEKTWADYFREAAFNNMQRITAVAEAADEAGYTLSDEARDQVEAALDSLPSIAEQSGAGSVKSYLAVTYGRGCSEKTLEDMMLLSSLAAEYAESVYNGFSYTDEELETYYTDNADDLDVIDYSFYFASGAADEESDTDSETAMKAAKDMADAIAADTADEESFTEAVAEYADGAEPTRNSSPGSSLSADYSEWLLSSDRQSGDVTVIETDTGYYALLYRDRDDNHYNMVSVRHILIGAQADENGEYTDEALDAAQTQAGEVYDEWKNGEATEESFAELANRYSTDGGSNQTGGLYENIHKGQMVDEFDAFCFEDHEKGDTDIVFGESSSYAGYHIIYYVGENGLYSNYLADQNLRNEDYTQWENDLVENYEVKTRIAIGFAE